jgi:hypothetical protein
MLTAAIAAARITFERFAMMVSFPVSEWPTRRLPCYPMHRGLDYIAANSITLSRGAADCGEHRQVATAIASVIASALLRQCGHCVVSLVSPNEFFSTWCRLAHFPEYFFQLGEVVSRITQQRRGAADRREHRQAAGAGALKRYNLRQSGTSEVRICSSASAWLVISLFMASAPYDACANSRH